MAQRKHNIYTHFLKDRTCEICKRTKISRAPCRKRTGEALPRAENFGQLKTADHMVLSEDCESRNNHRYAVVVQDLAINGFNLIGAEQKHLRRRKRVEESLSTHRKSRRSFKLIIPWNLANPVKICHGINELRHLVDLRRMVLRKEQCAE